MPHHHTRRHWLTSTAGGLGSIALATMLAEERDAAAAGTSAAGPHAACVYPAKAKRVVQLFMGGAASHIDLFDHKPALIRHAGKPSAICF